MLTFWQKKKIEKEKEKKCIKNVDILEYLSGGFLLLWVKGFIKELPL